MQSSGVGGARSRGCWRFVAVAVVCLLPLAASARDEYSKEGAKACLDCHGTDYVLGILDTVHAETSDPDTPASQKQCQSCHGPSAVHIQFPMQVSNVHFGKQSSSKPEVQNKQCLECHADGDRESWSASAHGYELLVCSTCHSLPNRGSRRIERLPQQEVIRIGGSRITM